ncbi:MAG: hypothetical protein JRC99_11545, partial [Deltaproteobacteria bacterium]|nr:hypothetical protein [Deltaproteobacteria bacterium]
MSQVKTFVIRRSLVVPMGLLIALTMALLVVCIIQAQPLAKIIILVVLIVPLSALFAECAFRRIVIGQDEVTAFRPFRQRQMCFADVTSLET